jgi:hypothetical protein
MNYNTEEDDELAFLGLIDEKDEIINNQICEKNNNCKQKESKQNSFELFFLRNEEYFDDIFIEKFFLLTYKSVKNIVLRNKFQKIFKEFKTIKIDKNFNCDLHFLICKCLQKIQKYKSKIQYENKKHEFKNKNGIYLKGDSKEEVIEFLKKIDTSQKITDLKCGICDFLKRKWKGNKIPLKIFTVMLLQSKLRISMENINYEYIKTYIINRIIGQSKITFKEFDIFCKDLEKILKYYKDILNIFKSYELYTLFITKKTKTKITNSNCKKRKRIKEKQKNKRIKV